LQQFCTGLEASSWLPSLIPTNIGMRSLIRASLFRVKWVLRHFFLLWPWIYIALSIRLSNMEMNSSQMSRLDLSTVGRHSNVWWNIADGVICSGMSLRICDESNISKEVFPMFVSSVGLIVIRQTFRRSRELWMLGTQSDCHWKRNGKWSATIGSWLRSFRFVTTRHDLKNPVANANSDIPNPSIIRRRFKTFNISGADQKRIGALSHTMWNCQHFFVVIIAWK
jgi:hypothetical protein